MKSWVSVLNESSKSSYPRILTGRALFIIYGIVLLTVFTFSSVATADKVMDVGAVMPDNQTNSVQQDVDLVFANPSPFEYKVTLPNLSNRERREIDTPATHGPQKFGIHRNVPYLHLGDLRNKLFWKKEGDGVVAYVRIRSPRAKSIRFSTRLKLPSDAVVSFYRRDLSGQSDVIHSFTAPKKGFDEELYWSPQASGDWIGMEIRLPRSNMTQAVELELLTIAHRFKALNLIVPNALECTNHEDVQCAIDDGVISENSARTTLRLTFESGGSSYTCSGTLMNVSGDGEGVYIPYIITAAHCISTVDEASSVIAWWNYQAASCSGSATSSDFALTFGGADLLVTVESFDQSLIRLHGDPPDGASFSGWWVTDVSTKTTVLGSHHPDGGHKKFFSGTTQSNVNVNVCDEDDNCILLLDAIEVIMDDGTSEGGSSGAGLRIFNQEANDSLFVGVLSASDKECENSSVFFGEFRHFYDYIVTWFDPEPPPPVSVDDHGDTTETATEIELVSTTEGEIDDADDVDYFEVVVDRRGTIEVYTSGTLDTTGQLTSEELGVDISDDDSGESTNFSLTADVEPGVYYIRVAGYSDSTGDYTLHVEFEEKDDHGDTRYTATTVSSSARAWQFSTVGYLEIPTDIDVFEITLWYNATITIYTEGDTDTSGLLTDYSGFDLFENDDTDEDNSNFTFFGGVEAGTYYLFVDGSVSEKSEYKLIIDVSQD
ncbi:MAG: hypothetical protein F4227_00365 [Gammaproteobacteria bacterium]|nr:hypothetical protein [Gammaproteobacteria bacterium]MYF01466.1 hypothetical protein [Gammaproteobacteria bacterium]MYI76282.1 hypothetical protein [Gammaproteobacteria bacterium]